MSSTFTTVSSEGEDSQQVASESSSRTSAEPEDLLSRLKEASVLVEREVWHSEAASLCSIMGLFMEHNGLFCAAYYIVSIKA